MNAYAGDKWTFVPMFWYEKYGQKRENIISIKWLWNYLWLDPINAVEQEKNEQSMWFISTACVCVCNISSENFHTGKFSGMAHVIV